VVDFPGIFDLGFAHGVVDTHNRMIRICRIDYDESIVIGQVERLVRALLVIFVLLEIL
jgi:hypothetical protein